MTAAGHGPAEGVANTAQRPASHNPASKPSGQPATGSRPVQLGTAVRRKPVMARDGEAEEDPC